MLRALTASFTNYYIYEKKKDILAAVSIYRAKSLQAHTAIKASDIHIPPFLFIVINFAAHTSKSKKS
jgi:hypothetical protein